MAVGLIGARIRALREDLGLTQGQLAYKAGTTTAQVSRIERNERPGAQAVIVARIAAALDTTADYLLGVTNDPRVPEVLDPEFDPEYALRLQRFAERTARLSPELQRRIMDAALLLLEIAEGENVTSETVLGGPPATDPPDAGNAGGDGRGGRAAINTP